MRQVIHEWQNRRCVRGVCMVCGVAGVGHPGAESKVQLDGAKLRKEKEGVSPKKRQESF